MLRFNRGLLKIKVYEKIKNTLKSIIPLTIWLRVRSLFPSKKINQKIRSQLANEWKREKLDSQKNSNYPFGVNLVGYFRAANGLGEAARGNLKVFEASDIPFSVHDFEEEVPVNQQFDFPIRDYCHEFKYNINLLHINPLRLPYLWNSFPRDVLMDRYNIGVWYWELPEFPDEWCDSFDLVDEVWVASEFVRESIQAKTNKPVIVIPPVIEVYYDQTLSRNDFGLPADAFLFLVAFDVLSIQERKNPLGAVNAFKLAFDQNDLTVGLVIKINNVNENTKQVHHLKEELKDWKNCYFIEEIFSKERFNALLNCVDVYVSLHRSEGFGLIPAEAMYLGKPVIMTNWSGNRDFMTKDNCCPVDYELVRIDQTIGVYKEGQLWAEPDFKQAADFMYQLYNDKYLHTTISTKAITTIHDNYSLLPIRSKICSQIQMIRKLENEFE